MAAILELDENLEKKFRVFEAAPHVRTPLSLSLSYIVLLVIGDSSLHFAGVKRCSCEEARARLLPLRPTEHARPFLSIHLTLLKRGGTRAHYILA